ncbi:hypothetical protein WA538_000167, partial [Blastocystis sp. DL]
MSFGYVDCSSEKTLCAEHNIRKYPTIKYVTNHVIHDYYGRNSLRSLVEVCDSLSQDSLVLVHNDAEMNSLLKQSTVLFFCVYVHQERWSFVGRLFRRSASLPSLPERVPAPPPLHEIRCHEDLADHASPHPAALRHSSGKRGGPAVLSSLRRRGAADDDVDSSAHLAAAPGVSRLRVQRYRSQREANASLRPESRLLRGFCSVRRVEAAGAIASLERSSDRSSESQMKKTFVFAYLDGNEWEQYIREFGLETSNVPCAIVMSERTGKYYSPVPIDRDVIVDYLASVMKNTRSPVLASSIRYYVSHYL